jgi:hypothetical protein
MVILADVTHVIVADATVTFDRFFTVTGACLQVVA